MPDGNYLLELLLSARDTASPKIEALQRKVAALKAEAATMDISSDLGAAADEADRAAKSHGTLNKAQRETQKVEQEGHRTTQREAPRTSAATRDVADAHSAAGDAARDSAAAHSDLGAGIRDTTGATDDAANAQAKLKEKVDAATKSFDELSDSFESGSGDLRELRQDLQASSQELGALSKRFETLSEDARGLRQISEDATAMAKQLSTLQQTSRQPLINSMGIDKAKQDLSSLTAEFQKFQNAQNAAADDQARQLTARTYQSRFGSVARNLPTSGPDFDRAVQGQLAARAIASPPKSAPATDPMRDAIAQGDALIGRLGKLDVAARNNVASNKELEVGYKDLASGLTSVWKQMEVGSEDAEKFGRAMEDAGKKAGNIDLARSSSGFGQMAQQVGAATDKVGLNIVGLSAKLRGLVLAGVVGLFQQLDTAAVSLAGSLFSVAQGAAQAGAALGGVFISGLAQLIPMATVAAAAFSRLKDVFSAVSAQQQSKQAAFGDPNQTLVNQLQNTNSLIAAEQSLSNAYISLANSQEQVKESQLALTQARLDAVRNLTDLTLAERSAQLQLEGSNQSLAQAKEQQVAAQEGGDQDQIAAANLAVQQAELSRRTAQIAVPRAKQDLTLAQHEGVAGAPSVLSAQHALVSAHQSVTSARQGITSAQRQIQITNLQASDAQGAGESQQSTVKYLESKMTAPEKALMASLTKLYAEIQSPDGPVAKIGDAFIRPFLNISTRLQALFGDPSFLAPLQTLADAMSKAIGAISNTIFGKQGTSFFENMAGDATKNVPIITKSITGLMGIFEEIAKAAAPAFTRLSKDWASLWTSLDNKGGTSQGQASLTAFFNHAAGWAVDFAKLGGAIGGLFVALAKDADPSGLKTVTGLTDTIKDATNWVNTHGPEVTNFFQQAQQGLSQLGRIAISVGKAMIDLFNVESLNAFSTLLTDVVIPAAADLAKAVGFLVTGLIKFFNLIPGGKDILEGLVAAFLGLLAINRIIGLVTKATTVISGFGDAFKAMTAKTDESWFTKIGNAWGALTTRIGKGKTALTDAKKATDDLAGAQGKGATAGNADATAQAAVDAAEAPSAKDGAADATAQGGLDTAEGTGTTVGTTDAAAQTAVGATEGAGAAGGATALGEGAGAAGGLGLGGGAAAAGGIGLGAALGLGAGAVGVGALVYALFGAKGSPLAAANLPKTYQGDIKQDPGASRFGPIGYNVGGASGQAIMQAEQAAKTSAAIKSLHDGLKGISDPAELSAQKLQKMYGFAEKILLMPDITKKQRDGLDQLITKLNPATVSIQKFDKQWGSTFADISSTTGNVMQQVAATLKTDLANISANLGTGTQHGAEALVGTITGAYSAITQNTNLAAKGVQKGLEAINTMLNNALKAMGAPSLNKGIMSAIGPVETMHWIQAQSTGATGSHPAGGAYAAGGWHTAASGGNVVQVAEGGHDEVTLTTDPKHASRQSALLGKYLQRAPHMAQGGNVWAVRTSQEASASGTGYTELSPNGNAAARLGIAHSFSNNPAHYPDFASLGKFYGHGFMLKIRNGSRSGTWPMTDEGDGSSYAPAIGLTPAVSGVLGGAGGTMEITAADGSDIHPYPGMATLVSGSGGFSAPGPGGNARYAGGGGGAYGSASALNSASQMVVAPHLKAPHVRGVTGAFGELAQSVVDKVTMAANTVVRKAAKRINASSGGGSDAGVGKAYGTIPAPMSSDYRDPPTAGPAGLGSFGGLTVAKWIVPMLQYGRQHGWGGNITSGYRPGNDPGTATGGIGEHAGTQYPHGAVDFGGPGPLDTPSGENRAAFFAAAHAYKGFQIIPEQFPPYPQYPQGDAGHASGTGHAAGGLIGGIGNIKAKLRAYASGGMAPWGGAPVPIIAHEGERIANPMQWSEVAKMAGTTTTGLDAHLGYNTKSPRQSFASGGIASGALGSAGTGIRGTTTVASINLAQLNQFLTGITADLLDMDPGSLANGLQTVNTVFSQLSKGFKIINSMSGGSAKAELGKFNSLLNALDNTTDGLFQQLTQAFTTFQNNLANWVTNTTMRVRQVSPGSAGNLAGPRWAYHTSPNGLTTGSGYAGVSYSGPSLNASNIGNVGQASVDKLTDNSLVQQGQYIQGVEKAVQEAMNQTKAKIAQLTNDKSISPSQRAAQIKKLQEQYNLLVGDLEGWQSAMNDNITSRLQQEETVIQDHLTQISDVYDTKGVAIQSEQGIAQAKGNLGALPSLDNQLAANSLAQLPGLKNALKAAEKTNDPDLIAQIKQQMSQLKETAAQAAVQAITDAQAAIDQASQTQQSQISSKQSIAQTKGNYSGLPALDDAMSSSVNNQITSMQALLAKSEKAGDKGESNTLEQEIAQLQATAAQAAVQALTDAQAGIEQASQTQQAGIQSQQSIQQTLGNFGALPSLDQAMASSAQNQINQLQGVLAQAQAHGDTGLADSITQEIDQLRATVVQSAAQMIQDQISGIQQAAATASAQVAEGQSISQTLAGAATTADQFGQSGAINQQALQLNQSSIQSQIASYTGLLGEAQASGNVGDVATITQTLDQLQASLVANTQALTDNTATVVQETASYIQSRGQFQSGIYGGLASVLQTIGQTTGFTDVASLKNLTGASTSALQGTNSGLFGQLSQLGGGASGLASLLAGAGGDPGQLASVLGGANFSSIESGQDATWVNTFETLVQNIESNTDAIATNNQQLATLNGQLLQPQTWSTTSWSAFRSAIFSGMGNLLPQYQSTLTGTDIPTIAPTFNGVPGGGMAPTIGTLNVNHAPTTSLSPQLIGAQLAHEASNAVG